MTLPLRQITSTIAVLAAIAISLLSVAPAASAQTAVTGSADFRNAPQLPDGTYTDRLVTGDSAWYSFVYTNNTPYEFNVSIQNDAPAGVAVTASIIAPTLTVAEGPSASLTGDGLRYGTGHTNVWFLKISLESSGQAGLEFPIQIKVDGVRSAGPQACNTDPACSLDTDLAELNRKIAEAEQDLAELSSLETEASVRTSITGYTGFIESAEAIGPAARDRLGRAEAQMARLCAPEPTCETFPTPAPKTPLVGYAVGGLVLLLGARRALKSWQKASSEDDDGSDDGSDNANTGPNAAAPTPAQTPIALGPS